jgi:tRNA threonylcarbamoyl adenosine modification protein YeaZ
LEQLIIGAGPGSFTGLRIGFSFMKGLASSIARPLLSVSSLAAAAVEFLEPGRLVASIADARREQIFSQLFWLSQAGTLESDGAASLAEIADFWTQTEVVAQHQGLGANPITVCVDPNLSFLKDKNVASPKNIGRSLLELGRADRFVDQSSHGSVFDAMALAELEPNYVRAVAAKTIAQRSQ